MPAMVNRKESKTSVAVMLKKACAAGMAIPAFNIPYLPMIKPVIQAAVDQNAFALIEVARLEWMKFESQSMSAVMQEFLKWNQPDYVRIHLDHIPVIDEDGQLVDFVSIINEAIRLGYHSVMIDGSRLNLLENIAATKKVVDLAHQAGIACEAELGAVLGHEAGPLPPYEELFTSGMGFTAVEEACKFVQETQCDWLSVAIGNIHGNISKTQRNQKKVQARLNLEHLKALRQHTGIPLVLHGGSSVKQEDLLGAMKNGIAKINIATEIRQPFEHVLSATDSIPDAQAAVFQRTTWVIRDYLKLQNSRDLLMEMD